MDAGREDSDSVFYPPGGILLWIILTLEITTFLIGTVFFFVERSKELALFHEMQSKLDLRIGTINTILLITSGYLIAAAVSELRLEQKKSSLKYLSGSILFGVFFLLLKGIEYSAKIDAGLHFSLNTFFTFYWLLTGFHFIHVLVGVLILSYLFFKIKSDPISAGHFQSLESGATFWHMCDLIWIFLFPSLYLLR